MQTEEDNPKRKPNIKHPLVLDLYYKGKYKYQEGDEKLSWKDYQKRHKFKETDYPAVRPGDCLLDIGNPGWYIRDYRKRGLALKADRKMLRDKNGAITETAQEYWDRVRKEIMSEVNTEVQEETFTPDQVDAAIAEAVKNSPKQADLPETDSSEEDTDEEEVAQRRPF